MALTSYAELQTTIQNYLGRTDLAANIPDWVTTFEAAANRRLRVRQQEASATLTPSAGSAALPPDYLSWRRVTWSGSPLLELEYVTPTAANWMYPNAGGNPNVFTIEGSTLKVRPTSDADIDLLYYQKIPALADGVNWLLTDHPDAYLFGSLYHAHEFMIDKENAAFRKAQRDEIFTEIEMLSNKTRGVGPIRVLGPTP